ncbi:MAG: anaerobic ribonucleoside-triphosphate reductase activating protein [Candidatus Dojkabacteria bacterium]|nr:anaerobic ribonucleoside-triphosphate reductase activating protein [Candidatus Dojkabacteria bacterium]
MLISGFEKNTLLDYPGKISSIVFTYGCNLRCKYCHNPELVIDPIKKKSIIPEDKILRYLKKRQGLIDALVITGGEPTLQKDLIPFIQKVKDIGYLVKLDTNGVLDSIVKEILDLDIVDYWAMDVKYPLEYYSEYDVDIEPIKRSISMIMNKAKDYEFRTTYVKGIHNIDDAKGIGEMITGAKRYYIQNFRKGKTIDPQLDSSNSFTEQELKQIKKNISKYVQHVEIR